MNLNLLFLTIANYRYLPFGTDVNFRSSITRKMNAFFEFLIKFEFAKLVIIHLLCSIVLVVTVKKPKMPIFYRKINEKPQKYLSEKKS